MLKLFLFVINEIPIPAQMIKIAVEFPVKIFRKCPTKSVGAIIAPKQKLKFTINIPKMAYALAMSKPIIRCCILLLMSVRARSLSLAANVPALGEVASFGTDYFLLKIKFLEKCKRDFTTKFAIVQNAC